jgi:hypothetical protein
MKSDWFGTAISNSGFMHSLLATIALHAYVSGKGSIDLILHHRAQAITAVNAAILTAEGISDANIGAVFNLLTVEESLLLSIFEQQEDHGAQLRIHQDGLQRMVQLRGGLNSISSNRILQAFMLWCVNLFPTFWSKLVWHVLTEHQVFHRSRHRFIRGAKPINLAIHQHLQLPTSSSGLSVKRITTSDRLLSTSRC